jgi:uncharacterized Fe-S cluster protein YjdI
MIPMNAQEIPGLHTEWAYEEEMIGIYINVQVAKHTAVVIPFNLVVFSFKKVPSIYSL